MSFSIPRNEEEKMNSITTPALPNSSLPISKLEQALSPQYLTNSYKLYWFLGLLDIIKDFPDEKSLIIDFEDVISRMIASSWYTILEFKLNFGATDQLENCVRAVISNTSLNKNSTTAEIINTLSVIDNSDIKTRIWNLKKYVPYRFLTTFITGLTGIKDAEKNKLITENSRNNPDVPYLITDDEKLIIDTSWLEYFYINRVILEGWARMKLTAFLQNRNPNVPAIHLKLEVPVQRNLTSARNYWKSYLDANPESDIFTNQILKPDELSIDHFIPWSFVLHDRIWNLVPTTREINSSKNNRLPPWERFFPLFSDIQYRSYKWHTKHSSNKKVLEDYLLIVSEGIDKNIPAKSFRNILEECLQPAYRIASNQGFGLWEV
ncbi:MAG: hypothetical protein JEZ04_19310 [Spirochaetales bacterium]|nr:hypothetical protein [Spirochaetales bacterium]